MSFPWVHHSFEFCSFKQLFIEHPLHAGNCAGLGTLRKQHGLGFYPCTACSSVESRCQSIKPTTGIRVTAWISGGKKRWLCANTQISDLTSMGKLEALSKEWMHEMKPEGMGEQTSRGDGIFTGAEAERYARCWEEMRLEAENGGQVKRESSRNWLDKLFCSRLNT